MQEAIWELDGCTFIFDIDGTLCPIKKKGEHYEDIKPYAAMIDKLRKYKDAGAKIVLFTSRNMNSYEGNIGLINKYTAKTLLAWLEQWDIPYDEIIYGKPWPGHNGFYVDDRTIRPDEFLRYSVAELNEICKNSKPEQINNHMTMIITMAGFGSRFRAVGYKCPKYQIEVKGKTLFEWALDSLVDYNGHVQKYIFIVRKEDHAENFIREKCKGYEIPDIEILELDHLTDGQATTCMYALPLCPQDDPIMIYNIDTYVEPGILQYEDIEGDGFIPCFHAQGDHWSFVRLDLAGHVAEVREKKRISDNCTIGAYYFSSAMLYQQLYNEYYGAGVLNDHAEKYVAPLYNWMVKKGMDVRINIVDAMKVHVLGTPEEVQKFNESF